MNFTVYRSSAGSGKTFTLVKEYLRIALSDQSDPPQHFRKILAITFTNKAAMEMKERILRALKELSRPSTQEPGAMAQVLMKDLMIDPFTLAERASKLLQTVLHQYGDFSISTIDSFTHRIIRNFAYDLGLPVNFEIETDSKLLQQKAIDKLLEKIGEDQELTETLVNFSEEKTEEEKGWQIEYELLGVSRYLLEENGTLMASRLSALNLSDFKKLRKELYRLESEFEETIFGHAQKAVDLMSENDLDPAEFSRGPGGIGNWFIRIANGDLEKTFPPNSYVRNTVEDNNWASGQGKKSGKENLLQDLAPQFASIYHRIISYYETESPAYITRKQIRQHIFSLATLNEIQKILLDFRNEDNILHISEFNRIIAEVVAEQPVPFIFEKLGIRYSHFLIDEFQDTSRLQWHNLLPLIENGLAENQFSMLVGDAKQAIYRWRGGEVDQFIHLPLVEGSQYNPRILERQNSLTRHYHPRELKSNFRSKKEIVEFNNMLFRKLAARLSSDYSAIYESVEQLYHPHKTGGYTEIHFPERPELKYEKNEMYVNDTVDLIGRLLVEGWNKRDIAVLCVTNDEGSMIANGLIGKGIQVLSSDSLLVDGSPAVRFLISFLKVLEHPEDRIALSEVIHYLNSLGKGEVPLYQLKDTSLSLEKVLPVYGIDIELSGLAVLPLYQQCEFLIRTIIPQETNNAWIIFFLDELLAFGQTRQPDRESFFLWWEERKQKASVVIPEGTDAVRIMTVHKSKGLEFPVVILPYLNWKAGGRSNRKQLWIDPNDEKLPELKAALVNFKEALAESSVSDQYLHEKEKDILDLLNVFYVACTRAVERLYILSELDVPQKGDAARLSAWLYQMFKDELNENAVYAFGSASAPVHEEIASKQQVIPVPSSGRDWSGRLRIRRYSEENWDRTASKDERSFGILVHHLLKNIRKASDVEITLKKAIQSGDMSSSDKDKVHNILMEVVSHPELATYFSGEYDILAERDILMPKGGVLRPDLVAVKNGNADVIDYKTGAELPEHLEQIRSYSDVLHEMGYRSGKNKVVYLQPLKIINC